MAAQVGVVLDLGQDLAAVDPGEVQVEQDQVGLQVLGGVGLLQPDQIVERLAAVGDDGQAVARRSPRAARAR